MLVYVGYVIGILILAAAGYLAWRNSRIIAEQKDKKGDVPAVSSYTVQVERQAETGEGANATPLLEAVYREAEGTVQVRLSRVNGTIGELQLEHAVQIMEHTCSGLASKGETVRIAAFDGAILNEEEKQAVVRLERRLRR
ncbi:hypothetical protein RJP21_12720 [Paenibacillus sp. VCA1]|uniref:Uncharacterized protein n=1 Tax=Paenibacillus albilobatus TaxID=2716884 RepID=A0A919XE95_9BACL|nr:MULTISPECIES: hypothetical protein [Paenibacillus]MDR9854468.1 hypothetical protein [Paenibacillus sp. VCA1]GIO30074.1 hypothetical protein J2TS6_12150 [Paenibacillus albilobatus]